MLLDLTMTRRGRRTGRVGASLPHALDCAHAECHGYPS